MLKYIPDSAKLFLELGCSAGGFGAMLKATRKNAYVIGVEIHSQSAEAARMRLDEVIEKPVEIALEAIPGGSVDCVVCNDILEHLVDPWAVLGQIERVLKPNGAIVSSIPNARHFPVFKNYFLGGDWKYEKWGVLDRTHLRFFTKKSIERLFTETGYRLSVIEGIFGDPLPWKAALLNLLLNGKLSDMEYERFACVAFLQKK
jgi:2-polyprenyl-3-methyl-5-hydroxy-6-metoxy-1,4-benzoquinol methylase